jgi:hypothetical protein
MGPLSSVVDKIQKAVTKGRWKIVAKVISVLVVLIQKINLS